MKKSFKFIFIIGIIMFPLYFLSDSVLAKSITELEKELNELEKEQQELKSDKRNLSGEKKEIESEMDENLNKQNSIQDQINQLDRKISTANSEIKEKESELEKTNKEIKSLENNIKQLNEEVDELKVKIKMRLALLKDRLKSIQESGGFVKYINVIFGSDSFSDLINRSTTVSTIMDSDKSLMKKLEQDQEVLVKKEKEVSEQTEEVKKQKKELESQKQALDDVKKDLDKQKTNQTALKEELAKEFEELEDHSLTVEEEQSVIDNQAKYLEEAKKLANDKIEEEKRKERERQEQQDSGTNNGGNSGGSGNPIQGNSQYIWPTDSKRITSQFNPNRVHPIYKDPRPHTGVDIGALTPGKPGDNVYAAATGIVSEARVKGNYGNAVVIVHGNSTTLYAHLQSFNVSAGQTVEQGQVIGKMGSTGASTAAHLHFEVHPGGYFNPVNPMQYFN